MSAQLPSARGDSPITSLPVDRQVTRQEAADMLALSVGRVRQLYANGAFTKYYNSAGRLRLDRDEVVAYRHQRETFRDAIPVNILV